MTYRDKIKAAASWDELDYLLKRADASYIAGHLTMEQVETLSAMAVERAREIGHGDTLMGDGGGHRALQGVRSDRGRSGPF